MFMRNKKKQVAPDKRRHKRESTGQLATLMEMVEEAEDARHVFVKCSGMHMPYVKWIIHQLCFRTWWVKAPFSCAEFVVPALSLGIPEAWENVVAAQGEMAVYAALFLSGYVAMFLGGAAQPNTTDTTPFGIGDNENLRQKLGWGYYWGVYLSLFNILAAVFYRYAASFLHRESDKLVVMWSLRWLPLVNLIIFFFGILAGLAGALIGGWSSVARGDACMDNSASYLQWYMEWVRDAYPIGRGIVHPPGEPVLNPWAVAAGAANITKPDATYIPSPYVSAHAEAHASFLAYHEFMQKQLGLQGDGCWGGMESRWSNLLYLLVFVTPLLFIRNPVFYWFRPFIGRKDPYDLAAVYAEFQMRAKIAQGMADKDANDSGFIGPDDEGTYELRSSRNLDVPSSSPPPSPPNPLDWPASVALDAAVQAALQQASLDPEDLRPYALDIATHALLEKMLQDAGVADVGARFKAMKALRGE